MELLVDPVMMKGSIAFRFLFAFSNVFYLFQGVEISSSENLYSIIQTINFF